MTLQDPRLALLAGELRRGFLSYGRHSALGTKARPEPPSPDFKNSIVVEDRRGSDLGHNSTSFDPMLNKRLSLALGNVLNSFDRFHESIAVVQQEDHNCE
jgi:hypothetical protein